MKMKERLLFDRVHVLRDRPLVHERHQNAIAIFPHATRSQFARRDDATMAAQVAAYAQVLIAQPLPKNRFVDHVPSILSVPSGRFYIGRVRFAKPSAFVYH